MPRHEPPHAHQRNPYVQIYILSRDRPQLLRQAIESALAQDLDGCDVIVSDNSEGDAVENLMRKEFPDVDYIRRRPPLSIADHGNSVFQESRGKFVVFFHDDDVLTPGYARALSAALEATPEASAAACNSWTILDNKPVRQRRVELTERKLKIDSVEELLKHYLDFSPLRLAPPFPGYMYRRANIEGLRSDLSEAGRYGDLTYLMKVVLTGPVLWLAEPLMWYREHQGNESRHEAVAERLRLLRHIYKHSAITRHAPMVAAYRFRFWLNWWRQRRLATRATPWRDRIVRKHLVLSGIRLALTHRGLWEKVLAKYTRRFR